MVKLCCPDVLRTINNISMLDCAIIAAVLSAAVSWIDPQTHGSTANNSLLNAGHWLIIFLLAAARVNADSYLKTDVEITWVLYGFMLGEVDADNAAAVTLMVISAVCFQRNRRRQRVEENTVEAAVPDETTAAF